MFLRISFHAFAMSHDEQLLGRKRSRKIRENEREREREREKEL